MVKTPGGNFPAVVSDGIGEVSTLATHAGTTTGTAVVVNTRGRTVQAVLTTSSGSGSATVIIEVSLDGSNFITAGTITFASAASPQTDGFVINAPWAFIRSRCTALAGAGASCVVYMGL